MLLGFFQTCHELDWLVKWVDCNPKAIIQKFWDNPCEQWTADFEGWICILFDQIDLEVFVNHKIIAENLEAVLHSVWVDSRPN